MSRISLQITAVVHVISVIAGVKFTVLVSNATGLQGNSVTLPCKLSPAMDVEGMEIRWSRSDNKMPVLHYLDHKIQTSPLLKQYQRRSALMPSSSLKQGDASIRIDHISFSDAGTYACHVRQSEHDDSDTVFLKVDVNGPPPILSLSKTEDDQTNVSCISAGWHPAPQLQWSLGAQQTLRPGALSHSLGSSGLISVQSWVVLSSSKSQWISCSVFLPSRKEDLKEARVDVKINLPAASAGSSSWITAFVVQLLAIIALIFVVLFLLRKIKNKKETEGHVLGKQDELDSLLKEEVDFIWSEAPEFAYSVDMKKHEVNITVEKDTAPACLRVAPNGKILRDNANVQATDYERCVLGSPGFSSGQHYWEVGLKKPNSPVKTFWWVGVATESAVQMMRDQKSLPPSGLWCFHSDKKNVHTRSGSSHLISVASKPEVLGIFLDYDNGRLSFYDTKLSRHLVTIKSCFRETVYPLFNPSVGDSEELEIISPPKLDRKQTDRNSSNCLIS